MLCLTICFHIISLYIELASGGTDEKGDLFAHSPQRAQQMSPRTAAIRSRFLSDAAGTSSTEKGTIFSAHYCHYIITTRLSSIT
jgi:hypothetical protein